MNLADIQELLKIGTLCSISVYGVTEATKPLIKKVTKSWAKSLVRLFALCCGSAFGYYLSNTPEGVISGFCGAALSAFVVAQVKQKIKNAGKGCEHCADA